ncbi:MAG: transcription termination/antitermination NusG family protein [Syntrophomonadaceae bacterium]|nr:transcription termination/antitermination NusG family protein [Syntrophomonadaceae bacterium]
MLKHAYCVSCNTGSEAVLKNSLLRLMPQATVLYPVFDREERKNGQWQVKTYPLLPGYLFIYMDTPIDTALLYSEKRVVRLLGYREDKGTMHSLIGKDLEFAEWLYDHRGHIKLSRAMLVGDKTKIIDGPLLNYEGEIIKINRQRRSALVRMQVGDLIKDVWLYFHWMTLKDGELVDWR